MTKQRRPELDIAKGFAIFLVILGHIVTMHHTAFRWIFSFHMPVFFFLAGITFCPERYCSFGDLLRQKTRRLLLPYFFITLIGFLICMARPAYRIPVLTDGLKYQLIWILWYAQPQNLYVGQIWFLVALFWAELIAFFWLRLFDSRPAVLRCFSLFILALLASHIRTFWPWMPVGERLPWKLDSALCASVFVIAGYYTNKYHLLERFSSITWFLVPFFTWLSFYLGPCLSSYVNLCDCVYNEAAYYYSAAFCGIAALLLTAFRLHSSRFWQFCGRHSMQIFAAQTFVIYGIAEVLTYITGKEWKPMEQMYGNCSSLIVSIFALGIMLAALFLWESIRKYLTLTTKADAES